MISPMSASSARRSASTPGRHEAGHELRFPAHRLTGPCKVIPGERIEEVLVGQIRKCFGALPRRELVQVVQAPVGRERPDHVIAVRVEAVLEDRAARRIVQPLRFGMHEQAQERVSQRAPVELTRIVFQLIEEHGNEVDDRPHLAMMLEMPRHVGVVLDGV